MAIEGYYLDDEDLDTPPAPYIRVQVAIVIPHRAPKDIDFLVDTGADATTLMPDDLSQLGINVDVIAGPMKMADGSGGESGYKEVEAHLRFRDDLSLTYFQDFETTIHLSANPENHRLPSLLGRDILNRCQCTFDAARGKVVLERNKDDEGSAPSG